MSERLIKYLDKINESESSLMKAISRITHKNSFRNKCNGMPIFLHLRKNEFEKRKLQLVISNCIKLTYDMLCLGQVDNKITSFLIEIPLMQDNWTIDDFLLFNKALWSGEFGNIYKMNSSLYGDCIAKFDLIRKREFARLEKEKKSELEHKARELQDSNRGIHLLNAEKQAIRQVIDSLEAGQRSSLSQTIDEIINKQNSRKSNLGHEYVE